MEVEYHAHEAFKETCYKNNENDFKNERMDAFVPQLKNFDVLLFQELFSL